MRARVNSDDVSVRWSVVWARKIRTKIKWKRKRYAGARATPRKSAGSSSVPLAFAPFAVRESRDGTRPGGSRLSRTAAAVAGKRSSVKTPPRFVGRGARLTCSSRARLSSDRRTCGAVRPVGGGRTGRWRAVIARPTTESFTVAALALASRPRR